MPRPLSGTPQPPPPQVLSPAWDPRPARGLRLCTAGSVKGAQCPRGFTQGPPVSSTQRPCYGMESEQLSLYFTLIQDECGAVTYAAFSSELPARGLEPGLRDAAPAAQAPPAACWPAEAWSSVGPAGAASTCQQSPPGRAGRWGTWGGRGPGKGQLGVSLFVCAPGQSRGAAAPGCSYCPPPLPLCLLGVTCPRLTRQPL